MLRPTVSILALLVLVTPGSPGAAPGPNDSSKTPQWQRTTSDDVPKELADLEARFSQATTGNRLPEARKLAGELLALRTRLQGADHWQVRDAKNTLDFLELPPLTERQSDDLEKAQKLDAEVFDLYGKRRYEDAVVRAGDVLRYRRSALGERHHLTTEGLNNLAVLYELLGRYAEAEPIHFEALRVRRETLGEMHPGTAQSLNNLGAWCSATARHAEAEAAFRDALRIETETLGGVHPRTVGTLNNLASVYREQGRYAEPLFCEALCVRQKLLGGRHADTAQSLNNLAALYKSQGRFAEAESLSLEALKVLRAIPAGERPDTSEPLNNLAGVYES